MENERKRLMDKEVILRIFIIVMAGDLIVPYILAINHPDYSHQRDVMSLLGSKNSPVKHWYNSWLVAGGLFFALGGIWLCKGYMNQFPILSALLSGLFLLFAIGAMVLSGLFPVEENKKFTSVSAKIHGAGAGLGFIGLLFVPLLLSILLYKLQDTRGWMICAVCFALSLITFVLFVMADKPQFEGSVIAKEGMWQRLTLLFMYISIIYVCIRNMLN